MFNICDIKKKKTVTGVLTEGPYIYCKNDLIQLNRQDNITKLKINHLMLHLYSEQDKCKAVISVSFWPLNGVKSGFKVNDNFTYH